MQRTKVKGTRYKAASSPDQEPDFYQMPPVVITPNHSDEESYDSGHQDSMQMFAPQVSHSQAFPMQFANYQPFSFSPVASLPIQPEADRVLDEAVDELFLNDVGDVDNLAEFVNDWDPDNTFGDVLQDDQQLGFMLDKLLED